VFKHPKNAWLAALVVLAYSPGVVWSDSLADSLTQQTKAKQTELERVYAVQISDLRKATQEISDTEPETPTPETDSTPNPDENPPWSSSAPRSDNPFAFTIQWVNKRMSLDVPQVTMKNRELKFDVPQVTMKMDRMVFDTPSVRMKRVKVGQHPEWHGPFTIVWKDNYMDLPEPFMQRQDVRTKIPEFKMDTTRVVLKIPEVKMARTDFVMGWPNIYSAWRDKKTEQKRKGDVEKLQAQMQNDMIKVPQDFQMNALKRVCLVVAQSDQENADTIKKAVQGNIDSSTRAIATVKDYLSTNADKLSTSASETTYNELRSMYSAIQASDQSLTESVRQVRSDREQLAQTLQTMTTNLPSKLDVGP
jgi:hypothetical protein